MTNYKLETPEAVLLLTGLLSSKLFLITPVYFDRVAGSGALVALVYYFALAGAALLFSTHIYKKHPGLDLLDLCKSKALRYFLGNIITITLILASAITFRQYTDSLREIMLPDSPVYFVGALIATGMIIGAYSGLKAVAKTHSFFIPIIVIITAALLLLAFPEYRISSLSPILGKGAYRIFIHGLFLLSTLFDMIFFFFLPPFLRKTEAFTKVGITSYLITFVFYAAVIAVYTVTGSGSFTPDAYPPVFGVIRLIKIGTFMERPDSVFLIFYSLSALLYLSASLFFTSRIFAKANGIKHQKEITVPIGIIIYSVGVINIISENIYSVSQSVGMFMWAVPLILPFIPFIKKGGAS